MLLGCVALGAMFLRAPEAIVEGGGLFDGGLAPLLTMTGIALLLGVHLVMAIGGGDMPVVVSLLNSYSGWAAAAAGFMLSNDLLIITGALVGSSGAILSYIMCRAMNRSIWNVVFGGFGAEPAARPGGRRGRAGGQGDRDQRRAGRRAVAGGAQRDHRARLRHGGRAGSAPGQGDLVAAHREGHQVRYAIHPVAGRLPGHMNVLLAEASVSYDIVKEMDEINDEFSKTDVVLVIGANDIVNPSAPTTRRARSTACRCSRCGRRRTVVMLKRGMAAGYAGVDNPLCYNENTLMLFGDARQSVTKLLTALRGN